MKITPQSTTFAPVTHPSSVNSTTDKALLTESSSPSVESFDLTWNDILYDGGAATWTPRSSIRWLTVSVCIIGVLGNLLAVSTLLRRRMRRLSTYAYLTALCLSNTITLLSVIVFELDVLVDPDRFNCVMVSIAKALASSTFALSTWITVGFTLDRYIMICYPFTGEKMCTRRNALLVLILCLTFALAYLIPQLLAHTCHTMSSGDALNHTYLLNNLSSTDSNEFYNHTEITSPIFWISGLSDLGKSFVYRLMINLIVNCFLVRIIPFLVVLKLNLHLIRTLTLSKRRHRRINPYEQKRNDVTHMLVIVISIYLVCIMPSIPFAAFFAYNPDRYVEISYHHRFFQHLDEFGKFLMIFNSASQCYLYIFFGKRFRRELTFFLCGLCAKYFYVSIPQIYTNSDQETFLPNFAAGNNNNNDIEAYELVLSGKWSLDHRQDSIAGIEFSFHHPRRWSRLTASSMTSARSESDTSERRFNYDLLKRLKNRFDQFLLRFQ